MDPNREPLILCLETSTDICSVALASGASTQDSIVTDQARMQTSRLAPMAEEILRRNGLCVKDCAAVADEFIAIFPI